MLKKVKGGLRGLLRMFFVCVFFILGLESAVAQAAAILTVEGFLPTCSGIDALSLPAALSIE